MPKFRLDRIIEIKNKVMDDKKADLERTLAALERVRQAIASVESALRDGYETMGSSAMGGSDFSVLRDFLFSLDAKKTDLNNEKENIATRLVELRAEMVELARDIKMLDTLKAKAMEREKKLLNRKDQKNMDDMALRSLGKKL